MNITFP